jgi:hypothetical protein
MSTPPPDDVQYLDLADYLWLAGATLDRAPEAVFDVADLGLAESALHAHFQQAQDRQVDFDVAEANVAGLVQSGVVIVREPGEAGHGD